MFVFHSEVHQNVDSQSEENAASETRDIKLRMVLELINTPLVFLLLRLLMYYLLDGFMAVLQLHQGP